MDDYIDPALLEPEEKFAIGQPVPRSEDPVLLRGEGHYADDISLPGQAYAVMVRSHIAHGVIRGIETAAARAMPGVLAVYTAADLAKAGIGPLPPRQVMKNRDGTPMLSPTHYALPSDKVRYVGEAVAAVIAETVAEAKDAAEMVVVDIDPLPAVTEPALADAPDAPILYDDVPANVGLDFHFGDSDKVAAAFAVAAHVTRLHLRNNRIVVNAMEPRAAVADYDSERQHWTFHVGCQGVFGFRNYIAGIFGVGRDQMRVLTERVGGSFGMKQPTYSEYYCILHAAREFGRPVKWTDDRSGSFVSDSHGRDHDMTAELALDSRRPFPRGAPDRLRQSRRDLWCARPGDPQCGAQHARRLQDAADRGLDQMRLHQHHPGRRLSRSRPARGQLLHGAAGRGRCGRDGHRPRRTAAPQPHPTRGDALQGAERHDL